MSTTPHPEGFPQPGPGPLPPGAAYYYPPPPPPRRGFWGRLFLSLLVMVVGASFVLNLVLLVAVGNLVGDTGPKVTEKYVSHEQTAQDKIAILPIDGIIQESDDGFVKRAIDAAAEDKHVKALVLRVDSPGGSVSGSDLIYHLLCDLRETKKIPIVVSMGSMAASGGYYVSMAVGHEPGTIFAERTGFTGSIGVIIPHYNVSKFMEEHGLADDSISSRPLKQMGSMTRPMSPEEEKLFKALIDDSFQQFKNVIRTGRSAFEKDPKKLDDLATGQIYSADQALRLGLVDKLGYLDDAVNRAIELAKLDPAKVKVVRYKQESPLSSLLLGEQSSKVESMELKALLNLTTPKAYYLATWLPGMAVSFHELQEK